MRIITLIEDTLPTGNDKLTAQHGLSLHISWEGKRILFDTGASDLFSRNADTLGVDLRVMDVAVLSHHHYDHGGGLAHFFELNANTKVFLRKAPDGDCYFKASRFPRRYIGLDKTLFKKYPARFAFVEEFTEILPGVYIFTDIATDYPTPKGNRYLHVKRDAIWVPDNFAHELIMAVEENGELVIFTGCSHNGLLNMIDTVVRKFQGRPIKAVIGGFHLMGLPKLNTMAGSETEVRSVAREVLSYPVQSLYTGHCTGQKAYAIFKNVLEKKLQHLHTGTVIQI